MGEATEHRAGGAGTPAGDAAAGRPPTGQSPPLEQSSAAAVDSGLACLVMLARFLEVNADAEQIRHRLGKPGEAFAETDILRAASELEIKARGVETTWARLDRTPLPAIARKRDGTFFILAKVGTAEGAAGGSAGPEEKALIQDPAVGKPQAVDRADLEAMWDGTLILLTTRPTLAGDARRFDISWFIPAVVKYRRPFGEVIMASFFIQTFALVSPLVFMVIVDKVLVHRGRSSPCRPARVKRNVPFCS